MAVMISLEWGNLRRLMVRGSHIQGSGAIRMFRAENKIQPRFCRHPRETRLMALLDPRLVKAKQSRIPLLFDISWQMDRKNSAKLPK